MMKVKGKSTGVFYQRKRRIQGECFPCLTLPLAPGFGGEGGVRGHFSGIFYATFRFTWDAHYGINIRTTPFLTQRKADQYVFNIGSFFCSYLRKSVSHFKKSKEKDPWLKRVPRM